MESLEIRKQVLAEILEEVDITLTDDQLTHVATQFTSFLTEDNRTFDKVPPQKKQEIIHLSICCKSDIRYSGRGGMSNDQSIICNRCDRKTTLTAIYK